MSNIKIYKNKNRKVQETYQIPALQYQELNIEPTEYKSGIVPPNTPFVREQAPAERSRKPGFRNEDFIPTQPVVLPNIKVPQQMYAAVDNTIIDDAFEDNGELIDNNDFYTEAALASDPKDDESDELSQNLLNVVNEMDNSSYLLLVHGDAVCSGPLEEIEEEVKSLVFGEHELCNGEPISEENLVVLKKIKINVGVFLKG